MNHFFGIPVAIRSATRPFFSSYFIVDFISIEQQAQPVKYFIFTTTSGN
jgi:hypothetical protein